MQNGCSGCNLAHLVVNSLFSITPTPFFSTPLPSNAPPPPLCTWPLLSLSVLAKPPRAPLFPTPLFLLTSKKKTSPIRLDASPPAWPNHCKDDTLIRTPHDHGLTRQASQKCIANFFSCQRDRRTPRRKPGTVGSISPTSQSSGVSGLKVPLFGRVALCPRLWHTSPQAAWCSCQPPKAHSLGSYE